MNENKYFKKDFCALCKGKCCKRCGCVYYPSDILLTEEGILNLLEQGHVSISTSLNIVSDNFCKKIEWYLIVRERNINRGSIDLLSLPTTCVSLKSDGCLYDDNDRPSGGIHFIPAFKSLLCDFDENHYTNLSMWQNYQDILSKVILIKTGKSASEIFLEDLENYFYNILSENYEGSMKEVVFENKIVLLPILKNMYPDIYDLAKKKYESIKLVRSKK